MAKEKNLVEDALIQMKNLEEAVAENAKGILASTMKQEIKDLVKESITSEQEEDEIEVDDEMDMDMDMDSDDEIDMDMDMDSDDEIDMDMDMDSDDEGEIDMDDEVIDLSDMDISDEDLLKVFLSMDENDGIVVKKDNQMINLKDENTDKEYLIQTESEEEMDMEIDEEEMDMDIDQIINSVFGSKETANEMEDDLEEVVYEIEMDEEEEEEGVQMESVKPKIGKGAKIGKPKFSYKKSSGGFKESMKKGTRGVGIGKGPKFEFKEGDKKDISSTIKKEMKPFKKKEETKEASRTYGMGSKSGRGLRKGITPNRNLTFENDNKYEEQLRILREKNEEYRKSLNVFRDKLNEVAVFNSNLAYATRLFTEHSTSKQEKINILKRFDNIETLKESKNLYRTIKNELSSDNSKNSLNESIWNKIEKSPSSGSAVELIESKTYENPQFLRMKDIMSKITK